MSETTATAASLEIRESYTGGSARTKEKQKYIDEAATSRSKKFRQKSIKSTAGESNLLWGDDPEAVTRTSCRILFQNVNGLSTSNDFSDVHEIGFAAEQLGVHILGMAETNIDWQARDVRVNITSRFRKYWKHSKISLASSDHRLDSEFQPGGTAIVVGQPWSGRTTIETDSGGLGRWAEATLLGKDKRQLTVICAYQVVKNSIGKAGPSTAYAQQWHLLRIRGIAEPDPNKQFLADLGKRIDNLKEAGSEIILMLDANDSLQSASSKFTRWVREKELVDLHLLRHGNDEEPPTYARGSKRIDYILATSKIAEYMSKAGILPLHDFCTSDHRALFVDIELQEYLKGDPNPFAPQSSRAIQSNDPRAVRRYREQLQKHLDNSLIEHDLKRVEQKLKETGYNANNALELDRIDHEITKARLEIEKQCSRIASHPWSPALMKAKKAVTFWRTWISEIKLNRDFSKQRNKILPDGNVSRPTKREATDALRSARRELKDLLAKAKELRQNHLIDRCEKAQLINDNTAEKAIQCIIRAEAQKEVFSRLRRIMKKENTGALSRVLVESAD